MKHLKKFESYSEDMMTDEEVKQEILDKIKELKRSTNSWATRDILKEFTNWGFWSGSSMASIDIEMADQIASELYDYVDSLRAGDGDIDEVYNLIK
jgi:hypothetical protein